MSWLVVGGNKETRREKVGEIVGKEAARTGDVVALEGEAGKSIGVDAVRQWRKALTLTPVGKTKVGVILEGEKLTEEAQNAILKVLEEPPEGAVVILSSPSLDLLLLTVVSRCLVIDLGGTTQISISPEKERELTKIIELITQKNYTLGFDWTKTVGERQEAIEEVDRLLVVARAMLLESVVDPGVVARLLKTKEYLTANANVRMTLDNLFVN